MNKPPFTRRVAHLALWLSLSSCGAATPVRYVIEEDLGPYRYRRFQKVLDVELPVADNPSTAYTATYLGRDDYEVLVTPVSVTKYDHPEGLGDALRGQIRGLAGYEYGVTEKLGEWVWTLKGEQDDHWLMWLSGSYLVKLRVPEGETQVQADVLQAYLARYESDLNAQGHVAR